MEKEENSTMTLICQMVTMQLEAQKRFEEQNRLKELALELLKAQLKFNE